MLTSNIIGASKKLGVCILSWMLSFLVAEGIFRMLGDRPTEDKKGFYIQFSNGAYKLAPNVDLSSQWASGPFSIHTDGLGLRCDKDRKYAVKKGDTLDLLFVGDSQGFGNGVNFEDTIAGGVAVLAEKEGAHVGNVSVGGHSLRNQLELVRWLCEEQEVRVSHYVILLTPMMLTACDSFSRALVGQDGRLYNKKKNIFGMMRLWPKTHAVTYSRLRDAIRNLGIGVNPSGAVPFVFQVFDVNSDEHKSVDKSVNCFAGFRDLAAEQGAMLTVVYAPLSIELDFSSVRIAAVAKGFSLDPDLPVRICIKTMRELGVSVYNLRPVLANLHSRGIKLHLKADFHYNADVSRACAEYLWQEIKPIIKTILPRISFY